VTSDHLDLVRCKMAADRLRNFLGGKEGRISAEAFDLVDWDANEDALKDFAPMFRLWVMKTSVDTVGWADT